MKRPEREDYFEYRGKQIIIDYGHAENYFEALEEYIDNLESRSISDEEIEKAFPTQYDRGDMKAAGAIPSNMYRQQGAKWALSKLKEAQ